MSGQDRAPGQWPADAAARVAVVLGTRPGIVKLAPLLRRLASEDVPHFAIHSGQHYSPAMDAVFFVDMGLPAPGCRIGNCRPGITQGAQTAEMLAGIERVLAAERPGIVLVGGDANTNLAGALAARKLGLLVGHVEAGLRSWDWRMPEEHNRTMIDHISDVLFVPSERARLIAESERVRGEIVVAGSTLGEALRYTLTQVSADGGRRGGQSGAGGYVLVTLHRQENVDDRAVLGGLVGAVGELPAKLGVPVRWPLHPRTKVRLAEFGLLDGLLTVPGVVTGEPGGHRDFVRLLAGAALVLTDSGGVQQEACILRVPCVTARESTEWQETVRAGANMVAGTDSGDIVAACAQMIERPGSWADPFEVGGHDASELIVRYCQALLRGRS